MNKWINKLISCDVSHNKCIHTDSYLSNTYINTDSYPSMEMPRTSSWPRLCVETSSCRISSRSWPKSRSQTDDSFRWPTTWSTPADRTGSRKVTRGHTRSTLVYFRWFSATPQDGAYLVTCAYVRSHGVWYGHARFHRNIWIAATPHSLVFLHGLVLDGQQEITRTQGDTTLIT